MTSLYDTIIGFCKDHGVVFVDRFMPFFISSIGAHILNLWNKSMEGGEPHEFCMEGFNVRDLRLHLLFIAPPGCSKSMFMRIFLNHRRGLYDVTRNAMPTTSTHAGVVGSVERGGEIRRGAFGVYQTGILGYSEFHAIDAVSGQQHSREMMDSLLEVLDEGNVHRFMAGGELEYTTYSTLWGGVQQVRFDLESGIGRRLFYIYFAPTREDYRVLRRARRRATRDVRIDWDMLYLIRSWIRDLYRDMVPEIREVQFSDDFDDALDELGIYHYEEDVFERLAMGYTLMKSYEGGDTLYVDVNRELKMLMMRSASRRKSVNRHPLGALVYQLLSDNGMEMTRTGLCKEIVDVTQMSYGKATKLVESMMREHLLDKRRARAQTSRRPVEMLSMNDEMIGEI